MLPSSTPTAPVASDGRAPLRVAVLAGARFPIREPFVGGLEAHTWLLATGLRDRGHQVTVFAGPGSDPALDVRPYAGGRPALSDDARADVSLGPEVAMWDHHAYQSTMLALAQGPSRYDVVHNNSVHHLPLALSPVVPVPQVTTLHTPPTVWMELAIKAATEPLPVRFCAVSAHTAAAWRSSIPHAEVIANAIDLDRWAPGPGGVDAVWSGRIVAEKGLHLAIDAARAAGRRLRFAGPRLDEAYWAEQVAPRLGDDVEWVGHLCQAELRDLVGRSAVAVVSPCWDEPFGLVALEALACGTPVAAIERGGLTEIVEERSGVLAASGGADLAAAVTRAATLDRAAVRRRAEQVGSAHRMIDEYVALYRSCLP